MYFLNRNICSHASNRDTGSSHSLPIKSPVQSQNALRLLTRQVSFQTGQQHYTPGLSNTATILNPAA